MNTEILETGQLFLRSLTPEVYSYVFNNLTKAEQKKYFGCGSDAELEEERKKYEDGLSMYRKSFFVFQLIDKRTNAVIGWCGFHTWYLLHQRAEIGYVVTDERYKRKGFMKEALPVVVHYGFNILGLQRIEAYIAPDNIPSLQLIRSTGFVQEGRLREHYFVTDHFEDSLLFSLLKKEYKEPTSRAFKSAGVFY